MNVQIPVLASAELPIPPSFSRLYDLAYNLWWTWAGGSGLWRMIDADVWARYHNPIELLAAVSRSTWRNLEDSGDFQDAYGETIAQFDAYMNAKKTWWSSNASETIGPIAYLCAEYGVENLLPTYSGGLGVLAGDHAKSASDLGVPFVATGLLYRRGYFRQDVDAVGDQQHTYPVVDPVRLPIQQVAGPTGGQLKVNIEMPGRTIRVGVWKVQVGRVPILLMDTDLPENDDADRPITHTLYIRGREMRFVQEYVLGVGSVRVLDALSIKPTAWHVNEGHAALSLLERTSNLVAQGLSTDQAMAQIKSTTSFTLHTPVPAGNEVFDFPLIEKYLSSMPARMAIDMSRLASLGAAHEGEEYHFNLSALAIRMSGYVNGVSARHGEIVGRDWAHLLSGQSASITNGVHPPTWLSRAHQRALAEVFGSKWRDTLIDDPDQTERLDDLSDERLWEIHTREKEFLSRFARGRILRQRARHGSSPDELRAVANILSPKWLTIGFARRFATYKRALLLFHNLPWLQAILTNPDRPVQILIAGKAHPADQNGQGLIRRIVELSRTPELNGHVHFLENYDMRIARYLVQGVDVWLNNPRPPLEASGTSGMKAAMNGGLNLSILDGWWLEGHNGNNGWAFGLEWGNGDHDAQDNEDAIALYRTLQDHVVPKYYERDEDGIPRGWVSMMREAIRSTITDFSSDRMVKEYAQNAYIPLSSSQDSRSES